MPIRNLLQNLLKNKFRMRIKIEPIQAIQSQIKKTLLSKIAKPKTIR